MLLLGHHAARVLVGALLVGIVSGSFAFAQAPEATPPHGACFDVVRSPTDEAAGAILLNRCTGQTWLLVRTRRKHSDLVAYRWALIATGEAEVAASTSALAPAPAKPNSAKCFTFQGKQFCE
jgi:hypothetical protein